MESTQQITHDQHSSSLYPNRWWSKETTAIVTGGNRGIGFEIVKKLAQSGLTVILTARDQTKGHNAIHELSVKHMLDNVYFLQLDVSKPDSIDAFAAQFQYEFGVLDILVNNAGVSFNDVDGNSVAYAETVMKTNYYGPKLLTEALIPLFRCSSSKSRILNISSRLGSPDRVRNPEIRSILEDTSKPLTITQIDNIVSSFLEQVRNGTWESGGWPEIWTDYAVSKVALNAYSTRVLAQQLKDKNIVVNCYCPGFTRTDMTGGKGSRTPETAADIAARIVLLGQDELETGKFVTGVNLSLKPRL